MSSRWFVASKPTLNYCSAVVPVCVVAHVQYVGSLAACSHWHVYLNNEAVFILHPYLTFFGFKA